MVCTILMINLFEKMTHREREMACLNLCPWQRKCTHFFIYLLSPLKHVCSMISENCTLCLLWGCVRTASPAMIVSWFIFYLTVYSDSLSNQKPPNHMQTLYREGFKFPQIDLNLICLVGQIKFTSIKKCLLNPQREIT